VVNKQLQTYKSEKIKGRKQIRNREICIHRLPPTRCTSHAAAL